MPTVTVTVSDSAKQKDTLTMTQEGPAVYSLGKVEITSAVFGTSVPGETAELSDSSLTTLTVNIGGDTAYTNRTLSIQIPKGLRLISGTGIESVSGSSYTPTSLTPTQKLVWGFTDTENTKIADWTSDGNAALDQFSLDLTSGTAVYHLNDGISDGTITLVLQAEPFLYDYSQAQILDDIVIKASGTNGTEDTDEQRIGVKLTGDAVNPTVTIDVPAETVLDLAKTVSLSAAEPYSYSEISNTTDAYNKAYLSSFTLTYPTGAVLSNLAAGYSFGTPAENGAVTTVTVTQDATSTFNVYETSAGVMSFDVLYPSDKFTADTTQTISVSNYTYKTVALTAGGYSYVDHTFAGPASDTTNLVAEGDWNPTYSNYGKYGDAEAYNTLTNYPTLATTEMAHNANRSSDPVRYQFDAGSVNQENMDNVSAVTIALPGEQDLSSIHVVFDDGSVLDWSAASGETMPGSFSTNNQGKVIGWSYSAPAVDGVPSKHITSAYLEYSKSSYTSGGGQCVVIGRPKSETPTEDYSEHTFSSWQKQNGEWVKISSLITNGFRWKTPAEFSLTETSQSKGSYVYGDILNKQRELASYTVRNTTGSSYDDLVKVEYTFDTAMDSVTQFKFPYSIKNSVTEAADTVQSLQWTYEGDDTVYTWNKDSGDPYPFTAGTDGGTMIASDGKYFASFSAILSDWSANTGTSSVSITGVPKNVDASVAAESKHTLTISAAAADGSSGKVFCSKTAGFRLSKITSITGTVRAASQTVTAGTNTTYEALIFGNNNSYWKGITFAVMLPPELIPTTDMQTLNCYYEPNDQGYSSASATLKSTRSLSSAECTSFNLPEGSKIWFYDLDDQEQAVMGVTGNSQTVLHIKVPLQASPFADTKTYYYEQMFLAGSNLEVEMGYLNNAAFRTKVYANDQTVLENKVGNANRMLSDGSGNYIRINKDPAWIIQESIADSTGNYVTYNGDDSTISGFNKNETGNVKLNVYNTVAAADVTVTDGYIFLSIPKASETVGNTNLNKESQLDFTLNGNVQLTYDAGAVGSYDIRYSTAAKTEPTTANAASLYNAASSTYDKDAKTIIIKVSGFVTGKSLEVNAPIKAPSSVSDTILYDTFQARTVFPFEGTSYATYNSGVKYGWLRASYQNPDWTVSFVSNGGSAVESQIVEDDELATSETPTRPGYTFEGWCKDEELTTYYDFDTPVTADVKLYANWKEKPNVLIQYKADPASGGTVSSSRESVAPATGSVQGSIATANTGYTFAGWYDDTDTQVSTAANYIPQKNADGIYEAAIYTAKFTPNAVNYKVEVYLHNLKGTGYTEDTGRVQNLTGNTDAAAAYTAAVINGYTLETSKTTYEKTGTAAGAAVLPIAGDGSLVIKLYYARKDYKVTFANPSEGGTVNNGTEQTVTYGAKPTAGATVTPTNADWIHTGWSYSTTLDDGTIKTGTITGTDYTSLIIEGTTVLTPTMAHVPFGQINTSGNGAVAVDKGSSVTIGTLTTDKEEFTEAETVHNLAFMWKPNDHYEIDKIEVSFPTVTGSTPIDITNSTGDITAVLGATNATAANKSGDTLTITGLNNSMVVNVTFKIIKRTVTFDQNYTGSPEAQIVSVNDGDTVNRPANPTRTGYTFGGWYTDSACTAGNEWNFNTALTQDQTLYAKWTENKVTISYQSEDTVKGTVDKASETIGILTENAAGAAASAETGYEFVNWTNGAGDIVGTEAGYTPTKSGDPAMNTADTYTAHFQAKKYQLTVHYVYEDNTTAHEDAVSSVAFNTDYSVTSPAVVGYHPDRTAVTGTMGAEDTEITVTYSPNTDTKYVVRYYQQTVSGDKDDLASGYAEISDDKTDATGTTKTDIDAALLVKNYAGFIEPAYKVTYEAEGTEASETALTIAPDGSLVVKVYFIRDEYTVSFDMNGGSPAESDQTVRYEGTANDPGTSYSKAGYTFVRWEIEDPANPGTWIAYDFSTPITADIQLRAAWKANPSVPADNTDSGRTCQDDGYPAGYYWSDAQQSCILPYGQTSKGFKVPNTADKTN